MRSQLNGGNAVEGIYCMVKVQLAAYRSEN